MKFSIEFPPANTRSILYVQDTSIIALPSPHTRRQKTVGVPNAVGRKPVRAGVGCEVVGDDEPKRNTEYGMCLPDTGKLPRADIRC